MTLLRTITRATPSSQCRYVRGISNIQKPQAYLRPLVNSEGAEEFEGVMCLVMDRKEAKNALSVQMVGVSHFFSLWSDGLMIGNEGSYSEITIYKFVRPSQLDSLGRHTG
jgi:hypothetical protein